MLDDIKLHVAALKLEPGGTYAIEIQQSLGANMMVELRDQLMVVAKELGVTLFLLGPNLKIARDDRKVVDA